jgi:4-hydroxy-tetrahydrodipicolinate reductase
MAEAGSEIRVVVCGTGKMGREMAAGLDAQPDIRIVGVLEGKSDATEFTLPSGGRVPQSADPAGLFARVQADAVVDFTFHEWTQKVAPAAVAAGVRPVIGTSGLPDSFVDQLARECAAQKVGGIVAPNFALGAVLLMHLCSVAAPFFEYAEVIELHHEQKVDAPSGTAMATLREMLASRGRPFTHPETQKFTIPGTRGGLEGGVTVHSVRLQGLVAHQEVIFGALGQTLTLRHDTTSRESFLPGVLLAVRHLMTRTELVVGLDRLMGLTP